MTIIVLTSCPPKLRGDLTKWMAEINTGVYVGKLSARVRDELWERICENIKSGQATMVFPSDNEQHIDFRVHNTTWEIVDLDGIKLMRRPSPEALEKREKPVLPSGFSKAAKNQKLSNIQKKQTGQKIPESYIVLDIETTGLDNRKDKIIEIAAIRIKNGFQDSLFSKLISIQGHLPEAVTAITGITDDLLYQSGEPIEVVLSQFLDFLEELPIVSHNASFDVNFIQAWLRKNNLPILKNKIIDTLQMARKKIKSITSYKLSDIAEYYGLDCSNVHRALTDCQLVQEIFLRLNQT